VLGARRGWWGVHLAGVIGWPHRWVKRPMGFKGDEGVMERLIACLLGGEFGGKEDSEMDDGEVRERVKWKDGN